MPRGLPIAPAGPAPAGRPEGTGPTAGPVPRPRPGAAGPTGSATRRRQPADPALRAALSVTAALTAARAENFPVAPWLLPARLRRHLTAVYRFARLVDTVGDEVPGPRARLLDRLDDELELVFAGAPSRLPVLAGLAGTVAACRLPIVPFRRLIEANRRDQWTTCYPTFTELLDYCTLSAEPVGRLVLQVLGLADPRRLALSDRVCTGLQLAEHCQDVAEDHARGRIYLPLEDLDRFGVRPADLAGPACPPAVRALLACQVVRTGRLLAEGAPLVPLIPGRPRLAVAGYLAGGRAALAGIAAAGYDVLGRPPRRRRRRLLVETLRVLVAAR